MDTERFTMTILQTYLHNCWDILLEVAPWLLFGLFLAGMIHIFMPEGFIKKHLGGKRFSDVFKAVAFGVPMPLCSCGVIPAAVGLKKEGASDGASLGFLISTPQTGIDSILVSATFLGWPFAIFKVFSALISGLIGGLWVNLTDKTNNSTITPPKNCCCSKETTQPKKNKLKELFSYAFSQLLKDIYLWLIIGILAAAFISTAIPEGKLQNVWWTQGVPGLIAMLLISLPMYICATASVPLAASLVIAGMSPGAALVLLMAGPTTNVATIGTIYRSFGKRIVTIYLTTVITMSLILATIFDHFLKNVSVNHQHLHSLPHWLSITSAIILMLALIYFSAKSLMDRLKKSPTSKSCCSEDNKPESNNLLQIRR